jgi:hypothetical protein
MNSSVSYGRTMRHRAWLSPNAGGLLSNLLSPLTARRETLESSSLASSSYTASDPAGRVLLSHHQPSHVAAKQDHQGQLPLSPIVKTWLHRYIALPTPLRKAGFWIV